MLVSRRFLITSAASAIVVPNSGYDVMDLRHDDGRTTQYRVSIPPKPGRWRVMLFSHGANSANTSYDRLWRVWAARNYFVIGANHLDSGPPALQAKVDRGTVYRTRLEDTRLPLERRSVFDALAHAHGGKLDWSGVAAAGHSFGAVIAQALAGARIMAPGETGARSIPAIVGACIALSPPGPLKDFVPIDAWRGVTTPSLLQAGDADVLPGFVDNWHDRLQGFAGPPNRWILIGHGVDHYFGGLICRLRPGWRRERARAGRDGDAHAGFPRRLFEA